MFAVEQRAPHVVHVCDDIACGPQGGEEIAARLTDELGPEGKGDDACWVRSPCLGLCERAPAVLLQRTRRPDVSLAPATAEAVAGELARPVGPDTGVAADLPADLAFADTAVSAPQTGGDRAGLRLLRRVGLVDPESLDDYRAHGGYTALRRAIEFGPTRVIKEVTDASLTGRGGAAFPTGVKWDGVARAPERPHYLVCNADESEPGTFKDRVLMEGDPFAVLESLTIAGLATGSEKGFIYIRGEYPLATRMLERAIEQAYGHGFLGDDVMGAGFSFDVELRRGAGAYICGEETSLFNSIEGKRGEPRNKPPFPVEKGLFGKPTGINNVETLVNVLEVLAIGGQEFAKIGTPGSTGTRLFCLSGCVETPGVYEVEHGTTLGELISLAGGVRGGRELKAILLGGAAGTFVGPEDLGLRLTFEDAKTAGTTLGSGVVMLFDDTVNLADIVLRIAAFFRDESCGQCVPCRVGTVRQEEALHRLVRDRPIGSRRDELALIGEIGQVMRDASICGLGQLAANAVESAITRLKVFDG
jgi:NADH-quinone oxidoreductase subunit F